MYSLVIHPAAQDEIADAYRWYNRRSSQLGKAFLVEVDFCLNTIEREPLRFPIVRSEVRKARLHKFPYAVYFVNDETLERHSVIACFHSKRNPMHWQNR